MTLFLKVFLPVYYVLYFLIAFVFTSVRVAKKIGYNPVVLPATDDAHGLIGRYFKQTLLALFIYVLSVAFQSEWCLYLGPIHVLYSPAISYIGVLLMMASLTWTIIAQVHMRASWRIGIDRANETALITSGLFSYSRNPVFLGMLVSLAGLFLITPNLVTLFLLLLSYILIQVQIRLEEDYLTNIHGDVYLEYKRKTRRLLGGKNL
jgi:protein-S-isoprenylcysteine O-methyltransferase Ste14